MIVHFHGHNNDNLGTLEHDRFIEAMVRQKVNALLVLVQGPYRAADSFSGKMEDEGGFRRLVEDVLRTMLQEGLITATEVREIVVSAFSGGYRPGAFALERGGLTEKIRTVFLFDALYAYEDFFANWAIVRSGVLFGAYTDHLKPAYDRLAEQVGMKVPGTVHFTKSSVSHDEVVKTYVEGWLSQLGQDWKIIW
jgi:hypothetical protein